MLNSIEELEEGGVYQYIRKNINGLTTTDFLLVLKHKIEVDSHDQENITYTFYEFGILSMSVNSENSTKSRLFIDHIYLTRNECLLTLTRL